MTEAKAKLFAALASLHMEQFRAAQVIKPLRSALEDYCGELPIPEKHAAVVVGLRLKRLIGQTHGGLTLTAKYDGDRRVWWYRIAAPAAPAKPIETPPDTAPIGKILHDFAQHPAAFKRTLPALMTVDSTGQRRYESVGIHDPPGWDITPEMREGTWTRLDNDHWERTDVPRERQGPRDPLRPALGKPMNQWTRAELEYEKFWLRTNCGPAQHTFGSTAWFERACRASAGRAYSTWTPFDD